MANVLDVTSITDPDARLRAERLNILAGKEFILHQEDYQTGDDYVKTILRLTEEL